MFSKLSKKSILSPIFLEIIHYGHIGTNIAEGKSLLNSVLNRQILQKFQNSWQIN